MWSVIGDVVLSFFAVVFVYTVFVYLFDQKYNLSAYEHEAIKREVAGDKRVGLALCSTLGVASVLGSAYLFGVFS